MFSLLNYSVRAPHLQYIPSCIGLETQTSVFWTHRLSQEPIRTIPMGIISRNWMAFLEATCFLPPSHCGLYAHLEGNVVF